MTAQWYALRSKPHKEEVLWKQAVLRGFEMYFPRLRVKPVNPRSRTLRPYFPGYMFINVDISQVGLSTLLYMPYSLGIVTFGGEPAHVPVSMIAKLKAYLKQIKELGGEFFAGLKQGDPLWIKEGPFEGYQAIFDTRVSGSDRVKVLLEFLSGQSVRLELSASQVERKGQG